MRCGSKSLWVASLAVGLLVWSRPLQACSVAMCAGRGVEIEPNFAVVVKLQRAGLTGAKVEIKDSGAGSIVRTELTDRSGRATIKKLPPGDYWITVSYVGIIAADHCFHVGTQSSTAAKATLRYRWGDYGVPIRSVSGSLQEWQPGKGGTPIWNLAHGMTAPVPGATALLEDALTRNVIRSESDEEGLFRFAGVSDGVYVLHIEGGATTRAYTPTDMIVFVSHTATRDSLVLALKETGCGVFTFAPR